MNLGITHCLSPFNNSLWENSVDTCKSLILHMCPHPFGKDFFMTTKPITSMVDFGECVGRSIVSSLNPSLKGESEVVNIVANNTFSGWSKSCSDSIIQLFWKWPLDAVITLATGNPAPLLAHAPCTVFSHAVGNFQKSLEQDNIPNVQQIVSNSLSWFSEITCLLTSCAPLPECFGDMCPV